MKEAHIVTLAPAERPQIRVVEITGALDADNLPDLEDKMKPIVMKDEVKYVIFNFAQLDFLDSKIIGYLVNLINDERTSGKQYVTCGLRDHVAEVFELVGLDQLMKVYGSLADAMGAAPAGDTPPPAAPPSGDTPA